MRNEQLPEVELMREVERLATLPPEKRVAHIENLRGMAADPRVRKADRERLARKADDLERLLSLSQTGSQGVERLPKRAQAKRRRPGKGK